MPQRQAGDIGATYQDAPTKSINVGGTRFVYRRLGADAGVPVIFLHHLGAVLDNWDPRVVDGIAAKHPVVTFDNRGVGASEGQTPDTVTTMADDAIAFVRALGFDQVDLLGFSLGGFVAQVIAQQEPQLVRKIILAGTGPAGGVGIGKVTFGTIRESIKATLTFRDPKELRFFTRTDSGKSAARQFVKRLKERKDNRDKSITVRAFRSQLKAWRRSRRAARSAPLVADPVRHRPLRSGPGPSRGYGPLRGRLANHAFGRETLQGVCAVQRSESCDRNPTFGDDDLATGPSSIEPIAEVRAQLGHGYIHTLNCTLTEP